jgi:hypothetical protein
MAGTQRPEVEELSPLVSHWPNQLRNLFGVHGQQCFKLVQSNLARRAPFAQLINLRSVAWPSTTIRSGR